MTYFQNNPEFVNQVAPLGDSHALNPRKQLKNVIFSVFQVIAGVVLLVLSSHLAIKSDSYLNAMDQSGLNQYHVFSILVCTSFFAGILLIAQQVLHHDASEYDEISPY